jgi:hypothetical protein
MIKTNVFFDFTFRYWSLAADAHIKGSAHRFELLKNTFLRHCGSYRTALGHQNFILQKLKQIQDRVKEMTPTSHHSKKDELMKCVKEMNLVFPKVYRLPLRAAMKMGNIEPTKCRVMSSKMAPLWLCFDTVRPLGQQVRRTTTTTKKKVVVVVVVVVKE